MNQDIGLFVHPEMSFGSLYDSYRKCAELLLERVLENHRGASQNPLGGLLSLENSQLIYPLFFNYRQSLELLLKKGLELSNSEVAKTHNLEKLYFSLLCISKSECDPQVFGNLANTEADLKFFHEKDERGTAFRYEDEDHNKICILRLRDTYCRLYEALNSVISNFGAIRDFENGHV
jgi:hypothetical protein